MQVRLTWHCPSCGRDNRLTLDTADLEPAALVCGPDRRPGWPTLGCGYHQADAWVWNKGLPVDVLPEAA